MTVYKRKTAVVIIGKYFDKQLTELSQKTKIPKRFLIEKALKEFYKFKEEKKDEKSTKND